MSHRRDQDHNRVTSPWFSGTVRWCCCEGSVRCDERGSTDVAERSQMRAERRLGGAEAEEEAVGGDSGGTGDEHRHAGRGGRDRLQEAGAVEAADGAEQLPRGYGFARADGRLPPAFVLAA